MSKHNKPCTHNICNEWELLATNWNLMPINWEFRLFEIELTTWDI